MATLQNQSYTFDIDLELKDAGLIAANETATQVDSADAIIDLGAGRAVGTFVINATAVEVDSSDESYAIQPMFSNSSTHASGVVAGMQLAIGDAAGLATLYPTPTVSPDTDLGVGRYEMPFTNVFNGVSYRYVLLAVTVAGTLATGVNFTAYASRNAQ